MTYQSTILIVDDEPAGRDTLEGVLFGFGYHLAFAADGSEALDKATSLKPDLILLDVMMPELDGFEVCRRLRATPCMAEIPILMLTALEDQESRLTGIQAGADDFISKPFVPIELRARVQTIVRLNRYRRLQMERARFEWVVEQTEEGYLIIDDNDQILYANPKARFYLGLPNDPGQPITERFLKLARKHYKVRPSEAWETWLAETDSPYGPRYLVQPESATNGAFWLQVEISRIPNGTGQGQIVCLRDVSGQIKHQRDMQTFHKTLTHKFRTPLFWVDSSLQLLVDHLPQLSTEETVEIANRAQKGNRQLIKHVDHILQFTKTENLLSRTAGFQLSNLERLVDHICHQLSIPTPTITMPTGLKKSRLPLSRPGVEVIFRELLENSKKFHPEQQPTIEISVSQVSPHRIKLRISDDGQTLSADQLAQVWTPYYQAEKSFTGEVSGIGLGLSIVSSLVWEIGGSCSIYNREGQPGLTLEFEIPLINHLQ